MSEILSNNPDYSTTSSPGAILKRCREYHNITLDEAAEATKIGVNYLQALEEDNINQFASQAYLKGFLRTYAAYLGLNADDMMRLYEKLYAPGESGQLAEPINGTTRRKHGIQWRKLTMPAGLLMLILITSAIINRYSAPVPQQPALLTPLPSVKAAPAVQPVLSSTQRATVPPNATPEQVELPAREEARPEKPRKAPETEKAFVLRMKVVNNNILTVTIDGTAAQDYELAAGDLIEWKADRTITLELSNGGGVEAEINGRPLKSFGPPGKPAYVVLDAEGIKP